MNVMRKATAVREAEADDLVESLLGQRIVGGDVALATALAQQARITTFGNGQDLLTEGDRTDHIVFVLNGAVDILIGGNAVATIPGACLIGEMALFQPEPRRTATVRAAELTVCAEITAEDFKALVKTYPAALERMIEVIKERDPNAVVTLS